ncbi:TonB-dependent receptor domain-containing protein [Flaviaesturariibacter aridisoli]|uniref:TonB-dependent receptor domain-containing protein n=1 Tax=Flaviaesturariibacter aridisoli TaxID=2545761 RepID=UPI00140462EE|nr:TonB-dependent receptor [Flaviaesturariibacter aridisoli]
MYAQKAVSLSGTVVDDASGAPIEYATLSLYVSGESKQPKNGTTSDAQGRFTLTGVGAGDYELLVESIGYQAHRTGPISLGAQAVLDLKTIRLRKSAKTLETVVVTAQARLVENRIDKLVFNAEKDLTSQVGSATDLLRKVPQVSVDADGNVSLAGNSGIRFLIDGKPSSAFGSNIADVLQTIPASQIKSIEVVTTPGARYDAEGLGGIINIILKKSTARGMNGSLSLTGGTRMENGSLNVNARRGKLGANAFVSGNLRPDVATPASSLRRAADGTGTTILRQEGGGEIRRYGYQAGAGFDWSPGTRNSFSGNLTFNRFGFSGSNRYEQAQESFDSNGALTGGTYQRSNGSSLYRFHDIDAGLVYKRKFAREDEELDIEVNSSFGSRFSSAESRQYLKATEALVFGNNGDNPGTENQSELEVNYTLPLREKVQLGFGGKGSFTSIGSNSGVDRFQPATGTFAQDAYLSNSLRYRQQVYALYAEGSFPLAKRLEAKLGARYERTDGSSYYSNAQTNQPFRGYNTLVPSVFFLRRLGERQQLKLSYARRIERPDYRDLNPFINTSDPKNFTGGNPYLLPEIGGRYELSYTNEFSKAGSATLTFFYRTNNHDIQPYTAFYSSLRVGDTLYTNVSLSTRENIGRENNTGINLFADLRPTTKFNIRGNAFVFHRHILNSIDAGANLRSWNYRFNINTTYQFASSVVAELFGNFNSARNEVQGRYPSWTTYTFALRKQFWNKKGSLAFVATNLFSRYSDQLTELQGIGFELSSLRQIPVRSIGVNFTWKFGKLEFKKEKEESNSGNPGTIE